MAIYNLPGDSAINITRGPDSLIAYVANTIPSFTPMFLFSFFMVVWLGGMYKQQKSEGRSEASVWFSVAGYLTFGLALILTLISPTLGYSLINLNTLIITLTIAIVGAVWNLMSERL